MNNEIVSKIISYLFYFLYYDTDDFEFVDISYNNDIKYYVLELKNYNIFNKEELKYIENKNILQIFVKYDILDIKKNNIDYQLIKVLHVEFIAEKSIGLEKYSKIILSPSTIEILNKLKEIKNILYLENEFKLIVDDINKYLLFAFLKILAVFNSKKDLIEHITPVFKYLTNENDNYLFYFYELNEILPSTYVHYFNINNKSFIQQNDLVKIYSNIYFNNDKIINIDNITLEYDLTIDYSNNFKNYYFSNHIFTKKFNLNKDGIEFLNKFKNTFKIEI